MVFQIVCVAIYKRTIRATPGFLPDQSQHRPLDILLIGEHPINGFVTRSSCCRCAGMGRVAVDPRLICKRPPGLKPEMLPEALWKRSVGSKMLNRQFVPQHQRKYQERVGQGIAFAISTRVEPGGVIFGCDLEVTRSCFAHENQPDRRQSPRTSTAGKIGKCSSCKPAANTYVQDSGCFRSSAGWTLVPQP